MPGLSLSPLSLGLRAGRAAAPATVLSRAAAYWRAADYDGSSASLTDGTGNGHDAQLGSTSGSDANDPLWRPHGGTTHLYLPGTTGNYGSIPGATFAGLTGDFDIKARVRVGSIPGGVGAVGAVIGHRDHAGGKGFVAYVRNDGFLMFYLWTAASTVATSTSSAASSRFALGADVWLRWTRAGSTVRFYDSDDGVTWTQVGTDRTLAGAITPNTAAARIGDHGQNADWFAGRVYRLSVAATVGGDPFFSADLTDDAAYDASRTTHTAATGQAVTVTRSASGAYADVVDGDLFQMTTDDFFRVAGTPAGTLYVARRSPGGALTCDTISPAQPVVFGGGTPTTYYRGAFHGAAVIDEALSPEDKDRLLSELAALNP